jgi:hypothetical protein
MQPELLDFAEVKAQVLRALRGRRSAAAMSKRLGLSPNQFSRWEASQRVLKWREFQLVCASLRLDLKATDEAIRKIKTMYMELYRNIRLLAQNDTAPPERVHLIVLHSVDVAQLGGRQ